MGVALTTPKQIFEETEAVITVSNTNFARFKSFVIKRSVDDVCGTFRVVISRPAENPFKRNMVIDIELDGRQFMRGRIYDIELNGEADADDIIISGRDITGDLIDSTVPDDAKVHQAGANLMTITKKIIDSLGLDIGVLNNTGGPIESFAEDEIVSCETGQTAIDFLEQYSRKRQLFINTTTLGDLEFFKAGGENLGNRLINEFDNNNNNVIVWNVNYNTSELFREYICKSQKASDTGSYDEFTGTAIDIQSVEGRKLEFIAEEVSTQAECDERAKQESNVRRARSFEYTATVQGFRDKEKWDVNQLVAVVDDFTDVYGQFFVKAVEFMLDITNGSTTRLTLTHKDAYTVQAAISAREVKTSEAGALW